jgi:hypothetical protein
MLFLDTPKELLLSKETAAVDKVIRNTTDNHTSSSEDDTTVMTVSKLEEKLRKTSLRNHKSEVSLVSVSLQEAQEMFSSFNSTYLHYEFYGENFVGNQVLIT